jgi:hypothetical protein
MIWIRAHPLTPSLVRKTEKERQLADGRGGRGWARSRIIQRSLYKSFITLWLVVNM